MATATILSRPTQRDGGFRLPLITGLALDRSPRFALLGAVSIEVPVLGLARSLVVKLASTPDEWRQALALVSDSYQSCGYEPAGAVYRFTPYHALPDTVVLVAKERAKVLATFTLVADNTLLGLPVESNYAEEIEQFRQQGRCLLETTCLAERGLAMREFVPVLTALFQLAWQYGLSQGGETNIINVTPQHAHFYRRALGYVPLGPYRACPHVQGTVGVALYLDPPLMAARVPQVHQRIFGQRLPAPALRTPRLPAHWLDHFASRSSQTSPSAVQRILAQIASGGCPRRW